MVNLPPPRPGNPYNLLATHPSGKLGAAACVYDTVALFAEVDDGEAGSKHAVELVEFTNQAGTEGEREGSSPAAERVWVSLTFSGGISHGGGGATTGSELPACNLVYGMTGLNIVATVPAPNAMKRR